MRSVCVWGGGMGKTPVVNGLPVTRVLASNADGVV